MKINVKRSRPKTDEEKLQSARLQMNSMDEKKVVFMEGESLSDDEAPTEISAKKADEIPEIEAREEELPEVKLRAKRPKNRPKKKVVQKLADGEFVVKNETSRFKVVTQKANLLANRAPKRSFRDRLLRAGGDRRRAAVDEVNSAHVEKWLNR
ncbi:hypothetical protein M3Y99_00175100 [Aphelenchoides fujianensis]|nr:hypothetical protein M3Y99_00175100 [Aphelenchoides fujianensis]